MTKVVKPIKAIDRIYYAIQTADNGDIAPTYGDFKRLYGAKEFGYVPNNKEAQFYQDNKLEFEENELNYVELTMNVTDILAEDMIAIFGANKAKTGGYYVTSNDIAPNICIAVRMKLAGGAYRYAIFYKGQMSLGEGSVKNGDDKTEYSTKTAKGKFKVLNYNGLIYYFVDDNDANAPADLDTTFFTTPLVVEKAVDLP